MAQPGGLDVDAHLARPRSGYRNALELKGSVLFDELPRAHRHDLHCSLLIESTGSSRRIHGAG